MITPFPSFDAFFKAVTGHRPHDWQSDLAKQVELGGWPSVVEAPTGLGKTATIVVAVYHLALQLHHDTLRTAPQRIFHVVNRRTLVDDTHGFSRKIADCINDGEKHPDVAPIRAALSRLLGPGDDTPVAVGSIHGDTPRDTAWLRATGCCIVTLTPHQYVSRLLMRAFGVSPSRRPIDAGLTGIDRLVMFDEPHLAAPAAHAILDAERLQRRATEPLGVPLGSTVLLGATPPGFAVGEVGDESVLRLDVASSKVASGSLASRFLYAPKRLHLEPARSSSDSDIANTMAARAIALGAGDRSVVVFANTVALAQHVHRLIRASTRWEGSLRLVTSRFRPLDREAIDTSPGITVATQCLEVGVDVSFDALVTEAAPWDALVQRLGRVNRRGRPTTADAYVVIASTGSVRVGTKAVYAEETVLAAVELLERAESTATAGIDASPAALTVLRRQHGGGRLDSDPPRAATLHSGLVPLMTHTRPTPSPDLPVEAFIAGPDRVVNREAQVAWRDRPEALDDLKLGAVYAAEMVEVPRTALARLLHTEHSTDKVHVSDLTDDTVEEIPLQGSLRVHLGNLRVWDGQDENWKQPQSIRDVLRAERVVLPCAAGGYDAKLGWTGEPGTVEDVHLVAVLRALKQGASQLRTQQWNLCLSRSVLEQTLVREDLHDESFSVVESLLAALADSDQDSLDLTVETIQQQLEEALENVLRTVAGNDATVNVNIQEFIGLTDAPDQRAVLCTAALVKTSDDGPVGIVSLGAHNEQVGAWAELDGRAAGLAEELVVALGLAGLWHDVGKADPAFQRYLAGSPFARVTSDGIELPDGRRLPLLAKSLPEAAGARSSRAADRVARIAAGLEVGLRHEVASAAMFCQHHRHALVAHLVGSHHGFYRPMVPLQPGVQLEGYSHADDFTELNERYGPWGLAYLEAVLRLADWRASAMPDKTAAAMSFDSTVPIVEPDQWEERLRTRPSTASDSASYALTGLAPQPLTGWLASVGLLAAAVDTGDDAAMLWWQSSGFAPQVPVIRTRLPLRELVSCAFDHGRWTEADRLVTDTLGTKDASLRRKNQKLKPANLLRSLLLRADPGSPLRLVLGLVGDAARADPGGQIELPILPFANNSSYPAVALRTLTQAPAIDECLVALTDMNRGYSQTACDGGLDRPRSAAPLVNGLGAPGDGRSVRTALAPLVLYGIARLGNTGAGPLGVSRAGRQTQLRLPVPTTPVSFEMLRSMTIGIRSPRTWAWSQVGAEWIYEASKEALTGRNDVDIVWSGSIVRRSKPYADHPVSERST